MRKILYGSVMLFSMIGSAHAADTEYNWNGFYLGGEMGAEFGNTHRDFSNGNGTGSFSTDGAIAGIAGGYDRQFGAIVAGIAGDISLSGNSGDQRCPSRDYDCKVSNSWLGTIRPRVGYVVNDRFLPYITGGLAIGDVHSHSTNYTTGVVGSDFTDTKTGWTAGAGFEFPLSEHLSAKAEYLYVRFDDASGPSSVGTSNISLDENIVRIGVNYKF